MAKEHAERRLTAILAADVAGFSRLMEADEEGTLAQLKASRRALGDPKIAEYLGRIVKTTGDGILVEFASVVNAVRCAVAVQRGMMKRNADVSSERQMVFRVGINVGDIIIDGGDIFGDGVNIAARLEALADPGGICISARVYEDTLGKVDLSVDDLGEQALKHMARPVRVYRVRMEADEAISAKTQRSPTPAALSLPVKPTIAVLPFDSFAGDERWQRIADGIVEEIITDLVRHGEMGVIARHSTFAFKDKRMDLREVGRSLGANYLLVGSVQFSGGQVRLNVQLVDTEAGTHLWAARLQRSEGDLFELEDAIVETVAGTLCGMEGAVVRAQLARLNRKRPAVLEAFELFLLGQEREKAFERESVFEAIDLLNRSLALDPTYARAWLVLAYCWEQVETYCWQVNVESAGRERRRAILKAAELDPNDPLVKLDMGDMLFAEGHEAAARSAYQQSLAGSWTNADALALIAKYVGGILGRPTEAQELMDRALRLNPYAPSWYHMNKLRVCYLARDYGAALQEAHASPETPITRLFQALTLVELGQKDEADRAVAELRKRYPAFDP
jgi:adenylate cyclase